VSGASVLDRAFGDRRIGAFLLGNFLSNVGTWIQRIAVGWLVFDLTASAAWVGAIAACELVPSLLVAPYGGLLADQRNRFALLATGLISAQVQALGLAALAFLDMLALPALGLATAALGVIDGMNQPIRLALVSDIAPPSLLARTVSWNSLGFNGARFIGPLLASVALSTGNAGWAFLLNALSFVPLVVLMFRLKSALGQTRGRGRVSDGVLGGLRHVVSHAVIGPVLLLLLAVSLSARAVIELLPAIAGLWFGSSPQDLAWLSVSVAVGAMAGGAWMLKRADLQSVLVAVLAAPLGLTLGMTAFSWLGGINGVAHALLAGMGFLLLVSGSGTQSLIQLTAQPEYRGRILSTFGIVQRAAPAVGALGLGLLGDRIGLSPVFLLAAVSAGLVWLWIWTGRRKLREALPRLPDR
jgi:MFS family permease